MKDLQLEVALGYLGLQHLKNPLTFYLKYSYGSMIAIVSEFEYFILIDVLDEYIRSSKRILLAWFFPLSKKVS